NYGTWFIYDPVAGKGGDGAIIVNRFLRHADFRDGHSNTIGFAEVKAYQPYVRNTTSPTTMGAAYPADPAAAAALAATGSFRGEVGHTEWTDSPCHQSGFTFAFTPNTKVPFVVAGKEYDIDILTQVEGSHVSKPSYGIITSRSYHASGIVNVQ